MRDLNTNEIETIAGGSLTDSIAYGIVDGLEWGAPAGPLGLVVGGYAGAAYGAVSYGVDQALGE